MKNWINKVYEEIKRDPFKRNLNILIIPEDCKKIHTAEFKYNEDIQIIIIPNSVEEIEGSAFEGCFNLKHVYIEENEGERGLKKIGNRAFNNCLSLKTIKFPSSVKEIHRDAFSRSAISEIELTEEIAEKFIRKEPDLNNFSIKVDREEGKYFLYRINGTKYYSVTRKLFENVDKKRRNYLLCEKLNQNGWIEKSLKKEENNNQLDLAYEK